jgi:hypothetical protein
VQVLLNSAYIENSDCQYRRQLPRLSFEQREQDIDRLNAGQRPQSIVQTFNCNVIQRLRYRTSQQY